MQFILEPFYKLISISISEEKSELEQILKKVQIVLKKKEYSLDIKPLVKLIFSKFLGDVSCLVDCLTTLPNAKSGTVNKVNLTYPGDGKLKCESTDKLCVQIAKLYNNEQDGTFIAFGRIISGVLKEGQ